MEERIYTAEEIRNTKNPATAFRMYCENLGYIYNADAMKRMEEYCEAPANNDG